MSNEITKEPEIRFDGYKGDWGQRKLGEVLKVNSGKDYKHLDEGDIPVYGTGGYMLSVNDKLSDVNAIGIGRKGTIDKPQLLKAPFWTVDTLFFLTPIDGYSLFFLFALAQQIKWKGLDESTGVPSLSKAVIERIDKAFPSLEEQSKIGAFFQQLDETITLHQRELDLLEQTKQTYLKKMFPKTGEDKPEIRFAGFTDAWEQRKFNKIYKKVIEKNDLSFGPSQIISVANMYYKDQDDKLKSTDDYMRTYNVMRVGDIAFEGNKNKNYSYGRFVENDIGDGIVSHVFDVFRPIVNYDLNFWKYYINNENVMGHILRKVTTKATMMTNLVAKDFLKASILVPSMEEQQRIGLFFRQLDQAITLHQRKLDSLKEMKKTLLQKMFV